MEAEQKSSSVSGLLSLEEQTALVTGASGNIGRFIARRLAQAGAHVLVHYMTDEQGALATVDHIGAAGGTAMAIQADLSAEPGVAALFDQIDKRNEVVTAVVNNAGAYPQNDLCTMTGDDWQKTLAANLDSAFLVSQAAASRLIARGVAGAMVNIASIEGSDPALGHAHYASAKAGLLMLTKASALEYGPHGIRCNAVSPGLIGHDDIAATWPDGVARWHEKVPLGRMGTGDDVANAVLFLLSSTASWVSGAEIKVDGGMSAVSRW